MFFEHDHDRISMRNGYSFLLLQLFIIIKLSKVACRVAIRRYTIFLGSTSVSLSFFERTIHRGRKQFAGVRSKIEEGQMPGMSIGSNLQESNQGDGRTSRFRM